MFIIADKNTKELYSSSVGWGEQATLYSDIDTIAEVILSNRYTHSWMDRIVIIHQLIIKKSGILQEFRTNANLHRS
jgi:hypothetical protein